MSDIEIELHDTPTKDTKPQSPHAIAIAAIRSAPDRATLARIIEPLRAWPEGPDKETARAALRQRDSELRAKAPTPPIPPATFSLGALQQAWRNLFGSLARTVGSEVRLRAAQTAHAPLAPVAPVQAPEMGGENTVPEAPQTVAPDLQAAVTGAINLAAPTTRPLGYRAPSMQRQAIPVVTEAQSTRAAVRQQDVVIGAREGGSGVLTGWAGQGEMTRSGIVEVLQGAGFPESWAPAPKSDHFHASAALTTLTNQGRVLRTERGRQINASAIGTGNPFRRYVARWTVGNPLHGQVGDKFGQVVLTAGLTPSGALDMDGDPALTERVSKEYERRRGEGGVYPAGEVTDWIRYVLVYRFAAIRLGANWYIPVSHAEAAERLLGALAGRWGNAWILPALPVATTDQLRAGLVRGLVAEADAVIVEFEAQREAARADRPGGDIGPKSAASLLGRLKEVYERAKGYATLLEPRFTASVRARLEACLAVVEPLCDDTATRFAMMDLT